MMTEDTPDILLQQAINALIEADNIPSAATTLIANGISLLAASDGVEFDDNEMIDLIESVRLIADRAIAKKTGPGL